MEKRDQKPLAAGEHEQLERLAPERVEDVDVFGAVPTGDEQAPPGKMKIDLHCHSEASADCATPLALFPPRCTEREIHIQAITDHNEIWGAQKLQEMVQSQADPLPLTVIVGEEVSTTEGEIIGLFLKERIEPGLSPEETVERIKDQDGLVLLPHGFDPLKRWRLKPAALERVKDAVDIVETFNARISRPRWNQAAVDWATTRNVLMSAGSDAHTLADIGSAWVEVPRRTVRSPQGLMEVLRDGTPVGIWTHPALAFAYKLWDRWMRRLRIAA